jgi:hypothetical protein
MQNVTALSSVKDDDGELEASWDSRFSGFPCGPYALKGKPIAIEACDPCFFLLAVGFQIRFHPIPRGTPGSNEMISGKSWTTVLQRSNEAGTQFR